MQYNLILKLFTFVSPLSFPLFCLYMPSTPISNTFIFLVLTLICLYRQLISCSVHSSTSTSSTRGRECYNFWTQLIWQIVLHTTSSFLNDLPRMEISFFLPCVRLNSLPKKNVSKPAYVIFDSSDNFSFLIHLNFLRMWVIIVQSWLCYASYLTQDLSVASPKVYREVQLSSALLAP